MTSKASTSRLDDDFAAFWLHSEAVLCGRKPRMFGVRRQIAFFKQFHHEEKHLELSESFAGTDPFSHPENEDFLAYFGPEIPVHVQKPFWSGKRKFEIILI